MNECSNYELYMQTLIHLSFCICIYVKNEWKTLLSPGLIRFFFKSVKFRALNLVFPIQNSAYMSTCQSIHILFHRAANPQHLNTEFWNDCWRLFRLWFMC